MSLGVLALMECHLLVAWLVWLSYSGWWLQDSGQGFLGHSHPVGSVVGFVVVLHVSLGQPVVWLGIGI